MISGCCTATMMRKRRCLFSFGALFLLSLSGSSATAAEKECIEVKNKAELLTQVETSNVLLVMLNDNNEDPLQDDGKEEYKELCERYQSTPVERIKELTIAKLTNTHLAKKLTSRATPVTAETGLFHKIQQYFLSFRKKNTTHDDDNVSFPEYLLIRKGNLSFDETLRFVGESKTADTVSEFLSQQLDMKKIGNFVYSIGTLDFIAANLVKAEYGAWQQKFWAYMSKVVRLLQYPMSGGDLSKSPTVHGKPLSEYYVKTCFKVLEQGVKYPSNQVGRLERMLEQDGDKITPLQKEELQQKIYTLKKFTEPMEVNREEVQKFLLSMAMSGMLLVAILVMFPMLLLPDNNNGNSKEGGTSTNSDSKKEESNDDDEKKQEDNDEK